MLITISQIETELRDRLALDRVVTEQDLAYFPAECRSARFSGHPAGDRPLLEEASQEPDLNCFSATLDSLESDELTSHSLPGLTSKWLNLSIADPIYWGRV